MRRGCVVVLALVALALRFGEGSDTDKVVANANLTGMAGCEGLEEGCRGRGPSARWNAEIDAILDRIDGREAISPNACQSSQTPDDNATSDERRTPPRKPHEIGLQSGGSNLRAGCKAVRWRGADGGSRTKIRLADENSCGGKGHPAGGFRSQGRNSMPQGAMPSVVARRRARVPDQRTPPWAMQRTSAELALRANRAARQGRRLTKVYEGARMSGPRSRCAWTSRVNTRAPGRRAAHESEELLRPSTECSSPPRRCRWRPPRARSEQGGA